LADPSHGGWARGGGPRQRLGSWNVDGGSNTNVVTTGIVTTPSLTMSAARTVNFNAVTQFQVALDTGATISRAAITPPSISGDNYWYDSGTSVTLALNGVYGRSGSA